MPLVYNFHNFHQYFIEIGDSLLYTTAELATFVALCKIGSTQNLMTYYACRVGN